MKKVILLLFVVAVCAQAGWTQPPPQRLSFSSGGGNQLQMPTTMGEPFGKTASGITIGSQQNSSVTVGTTAPNRPSNRVVVFPNPAQDVLNVQVIGESQKNFTVKLYDMTGREVAVFSNIEEYRQVPLTAVKGTSFVVVIFDEQGVNLFSETIIKP